VLRQRQGQSSSLDIKVVVDCVNHSAAVNFHTAEKVESSCAANAAVLVTTAAQVEDAALQARARALLPLDQLQREAQEAAELNSLLGEQQAAGGMPGLDDFLVQGLLAFFKRDFFTWVRAWAAGRAAWCGRHASRILQMGCVGCISAVIMQAGTEGAAREGHMRRGTRSQGRQMDDGAGCKHIEVSANLRLSCSHGAAVLLQVDQPACELCTCPTRGIGMVQPTAAEARDGAGRVEAYSCSVCQQVRCLGARACQRLLVNVSCLPCPFKQPCGYKRPCTSSGAALDLAAWHLQLLGEPYPASCTPPLQLPLVDVQMRLT
jgi:hypothetical protein